MIPETLTTIVNLIRQNEYKVGAELGVREGKTTEALCMEFTDLHMTCVDLWPGDASTGIASLPCEEYENNEINYQTTVEKFNKFPERTTIIRNYTIEGANYIQDKSLDFILIDATHSYNGVKADLKAWLPKIKDTGLVIGHDYHPHFDDGGLIRAVHELSDVMDDINEGIFVDPYTYWFIYKRNIKS